MLVLSREAGSSIIVDDLYGRCLLTVMRVRSGQVSLLIEHSPVNGEFDSWTTKLEREAVVQVGTLARFTVMDLRAETVRIGIETSKQATIHRLEVWEALIRETRRTQGHDPDANSGTSVPRPGGPVPPSLDVRLNETPPGSDP